MWPHHPSCLLPIFHLWPLAIPFPIFLILSFDILSHFVFPATRFKYFISTPLSFAIVSFVLLNFHLSTSQTSISASIYFLRNIVLFSAYFSFVTFLALWLNSASPVFYNYTFQVFLQTHPFQCLPFTFYIPILMPLSFFINYYYFALIPVYLHVHLMYLPICPLAFVFSMLN